MRTHSKHLNPDNFPFPQAYAEIESNTPGTVHGVTNTKGGKSSPNATEPQGETDSTYRKENKTEEDGYRENKAMEMSNSNLLISFVVAIGLIYMIFRKPSVTLDEQVAGHRNVKPMPSDAKEYMQDR